MASQTRAVFIHSPELERYNYPSESPFVTQRAALTRKVLASMGLLGGSGFPAERAPEPASRAVLEKFHTARYLDALHRASEGQLNLEGLRMGLGTGDCPVFNGLYEYAVLACGATMTGARLILSGETRIAFNPSGGYHHAFPERAAGFCYITDVALACMVLAEQVKRVLYLDVDVHHADGVQSAFYSRSDVLTISFHETGTTLFPGTGFVDEIGIGEGRGYCVNAPLPPGTYDEAYLRAFRAIVPPLAKAYDPDVIVLELGMDALSGDPLAHLSLTNNAHAEVTRLVLGFNKPLLVTGGGGYHVRNTVRGWALAWSVLCGEDSEDATNVGLGGVMLETTEWRGGLRDRVLVPDPEQRRYVEPEIDAVIEAIEKSVFPIHGLT